MHEIVRPLQGAASAGLVSRMARRRAHDWREAARVHQRRAAHAQDLRPVRPVEERATHFQDLPPQPDLL